MGRHDLRAHRGNTRHSAQHRREPLSLRVRQTSRQAASRLRRDSMNTSDPLEKRLSEIPMRTVSAGWRNEILRGAIEHESQKNAIQSPESSVLSLLRQCLWPHPAAWGTLAAVWVIIVVLNISSGAISISLARRAAPTLPSPELLALLREQRTLLQSLLAEPTPPPPLLDRKPSAYWLRCERVSSAA